MDREDSAANSIRPSAAIRTSPVSDGEREGKSIGDPGTKLRRDPIDPKLSIGFGPIQAKRRIAKCHKMACPNTAAGTVPGDYQFFFEKRKRASYCQSRTGDRPVVCPKIINQ